MDIKKIDETIGNVCDWIKRGCKDKRNIDQELSDMVHGLAELIKARTDMMAQNKDKIGKLYNQ